MSDEATKVFRQIAYAYLRKHYDSKKIPPHMREQIPANHSYEGFTDIAIGNQITQMLIIISQWFDSFDSETASSIGDPDEVLSMGEIFTALSGMFRDAYNSDAEGYAYE